MDKLDRLEAGREVVAAKDATGTSWQQLADTLDRSLVWTTSALLGQQPLDAEQAQKIGGVLGLDVGRAQQTTNSGMTFELLKVNSVRRGSRLGTRSSRSTAACSQESRRSPPTSDRSSRVIASLSTPCRPAAVRSRRNE